MQQEQHKNSFLNGFSCGLLAGAAAYFLFATDKGKKIRADLKSKWPEFAAKLQEDGLIADSQQSLENLIKECFTTSEADSAKNKTSSSPTKQTIKRKKSSLPSAPKKLKFKGV